MADVTTLRRQALDGLISASPADTAARLTAAPPALRLSVRGRPGTAEAAHGALGLQLPTEACRAAVNGDIAALWLGPDEWLVIADESRAATLPASLEASLAGVPHSVVDVSHRNTGFNVEGPKAAYVLAHGCPLDLDLQAFPVGMCTRTLIGRTEAVLWRTGEASFRVELWRTYAPYLIGFLNEARREFEARNG